MTLRSSIPATVPPAGTTRDGAVAREHQAINRLMAVTDEQSRRLILGLLAQIEGHGGIARLARITSLDRNTIARGRRELLQSDLAPAGRVRRPGAGRNTGGGQSPGVLKALEELLADATAGDPTSGLKWTHRSLRNLRKGLPSGPPNVGKTIARLLRARGFPRTNRKRLAGTRPPTGSPVSLSDATATVVRNSWPARHQRRYQEEGLVGNFKNAGRSYRRHARDVLDHDFPSWAIGRAIPYGIYDLADNDGYVVVGTSHEYAGPRWGGHPPLVAGCRPPPLPDGQAVADRGRRWRCQRPPQVGVEGRAAKAWRTSSA